MSEETKDPRWMNLKEVKYWKEYYKERSTELALDLLNNKKELTDLDKWFIVISLY